jgi:hypothetical protein
MQATLNTVMVKQVQVLVYQHTDSLALAGKDGALQLRLAVLNKQLQP